MTDDPATDTETLPNKQRGCGFLKHSKAYIRSPPRSADGVLPPFVEFDPYIPYLERNKFRGYEFFPGIPFELAVTGGDDLHAAMNDETYGVQDFHDSTGEAYFPGAESELTSINGGFSTDPPGEVYRHISRLVGSANGDHAGDITAFHASDLYMHVGKSYYENPRDFIREVRTQGLSKAIPVSESHAPPAINPGMTRVFLVHPRAIVDEDTGEETAGIIGYVYLSRVVYTEDESGRFPKWAKDYARTGRLDLVQIGDQIYNDGTRAAELDDGDSFGPSEGDPVDVEHSEAGTDRKCSYCGEANLRQDARGVYCPACGKTLDGSDRREQNNQNNDDTE